MQLLWVFAVQNQTAFPVWVEIMPYATFVAIKEPQWTSIELLPEAVSVYLTQAWTGNQLVTTKVGLTQSRNAEITSVGHKNIPTA